MASTRAGGAGGGAKSAKFGAKVCAKVTLSHPQEIDGDWEYMWFDAAHGHFLLLNESYFYLFSFSGETQETHETGARLFATCSR
jgi:hypothetical protein